MGYIHLSKYISKLKRLKIVFNATEGRNTISIFLLFSTINYLDSYFERLFTHLLLLHLFLQKVHLWCGGTDGHIAACYGIST